MSLDQHGHAGRHHGNGAPGCPRELHHHHDERCAPTTRDPFTPTPAQAARNAHTAKVSAYIAAKAVNAPHATRARVRVAALYPPTRPFPTPEDVDDALTATAPAEEPTA